VPKKAQFTHERVEYNVFLFDERLKGSKSLKTFKISLTFRFDKLWHLSKSVHIGENSQILSVEQKKLFSCILKKYSVELNDLHLVTFGIFTHVNFPVPLYFFFRSAELLVLSLNVINRIDNCYNLLN
jgi:hypothetical protein